MENYIQLLNQELQARGLHNENEVYYKFEGFVNNKELLKKRIALGDLQYEYNYYTEFIENGVYDDLMKKFISEFNDANINNNRQAQAVFLELYKQQVHMGEIWTNHSMLLNSLILEDLREDVIYMNAIDYIGQMAEGVIKPYICFLSKCHKISQNKNLSNLKFGVELNYLINEDEIYAICFKKMLSDEVLSQWRNVSYHSLFRIKSDAVTILFGNEDNRRERVFFSEEMIHIAKMVEVIAYSLKIGFEMVKNDLFEELASELDNRSEYKRRDDIAAQLVATTMVMGFKVKDIKWEDKELWLEELYNDKDRLNKLFPIVLTLFEGFKYFIFSGKKVHYTAELKNGRIEIMEWKI